MPSSATQFEERTGNGERQSLAFIDFVKPSEGDGPASSVQPFVEKCETKLEDGK